MCATQCVKPRRSPAADAVARCAHAVAQPRRMTSNGTPPSREGRRVLILGMPSGGDNLNGQVRMSCPGVTKTTQHGTYRLVQGLGEEKGLYMHEDNLVDVQTIDIARRPEEQLLMSFRRGTVHVTTVEDGGIAARAGVRVGMTLLSVDGVPVRDVSSFRAAVGQKTQFCLEVVSIPERLIPPEPKASPLSISDKVFCATVALVLLAVAAFYAFEDLLAPDPRSHHTHNAYGRQHHAPEAPTLAERPDYYAVLGLENGRLSTLKEIKKAFRKLATTSHPDSSSERAEYERVREAYDVLQDPRKKKIYDVLGLNADKDEAFVPDEQMPGRGWRLQVTLEQAYLGTETQVEFDKRVIVDRHEVRGCLECLRRPPQLQYVNYGGMVLQQMVPPDCRRDCNVDTAVRRTAVPLTVAPGVAHGDIITAALEGDEAAHKLPGDVRVEVSVMRHARFVRAGDDLQMDLTVSLPEALQGFRHRATHLDGRTFFIESTDDVTPHGTVLSLPGEGMPKQDDPGAKGDLHVTVKVRFPRHVSDEKADKLRDLFESMGMGEGWKPDA